MNQKLKLLSPLWIRSGFSNENDLQAHVVFFHLDLFKALQWTYEKKKGPLHLKK